MPNPLNWPSVLVPSSEDWSLRGGTRSGGQTFEGNEQIVASPTARWKASLTIPCVSREKILAMRQVIALGRATTWLIGPYENSRAPWSIDPLTGGRITYARGARDAAINPGWGGNTDTASILDFKVLEPTNANDARIAIARNRGGIVEPGMIFELGSRLYVVAGLDQPDSGAQPNYRIAMNIRPWLREAYAVGLGVEFGTPKCVMRFASDDTGAMELQLSRTGTVALEFVEAF